MRKNDRFYLNSDGIFVPSGTTVLGRPYLAKWAANCAVDYIKEFIYIDDYGDDAIYTGHGDFLDKARTAFERESMEAADYGTYIHTLCEYSLRECIQVESPHEMTNKFMAGFWKWVNKHNIKVIDMETEFVTDRYGGRRDLKCYMDGVVTLVDYKTGKGQYYENWRYQLAGYRQGDSSLPKIQSHGILKFNKETMKVNYKDFNEYQTTRTIKTGPRKPDGKLPTEKYTRTYEDDRATFNVLVEKWWLENRGQ